MATKKPVKKPTMPKPVTPVAAHPTVCCCGCKRGFWGAMKRLLIVIVLFAAGFMTCCWVGCPCQKMKMMKHHNRNMPQLQYDANGCLDMTQFNSPRFEAKIAGADLNGDGCITKEEMKEFKKNFRKNKQH